MDGPVFACFALAALVTLSVGVSRASFWWVMYRPRRHERPPGSAGSAPLGLYEAAFLLGGRERVAETAMAGLLLAGRLSVTGRYGITLAPGPRPRDPARAAVAAAYGSGSRGRDARQVRDAAARAESLRWVGSRLFDEALVERRILSGQYRSCVRAHGGAQAVTAVLGLGWIVAAAVRDTEPATAAAVVVAVLAPGVLVARLTPRPPALQLTREGRRRLAELDPDGAWVSATPVGRSLSAEEARTLAEVALQGLGALPPATGLARALHGPRPTRRRYGPAPACGASPARPTSRPSNGATAAGSHPP